jgi:hypothetical protein
MEFWELVIGRLTVMERSQAWLARRLGRNPQTINMYRKGHRPTPERLRREIALLLDIREQAEVAA